jgi:hypothetical protein
MGDYLAAISPALCGASASFVHTLVTIPELDRSARFGQPQLHDWAYDFETTP